MNYRLSKVSLREYKARGFWFSTFEDIEDITGLNKTEQNRTEEDKKIYYTYIISVIVLHLFWNLFSYMTAQIGDSDS